MASLFSTILRRAPQVVPAIRSNVCRTFIATPNLNKPRVQEPAPSFKGTAVLGESFKEIQIEDYKGRYLVLVFYPLDFTFVCPTELVALDDKYDQFKALNSEVIGISVDSHYTHLGWMNTARTEGGLGRLRFPLLSDIKKSIARDYDVLIENEGIALRGMFIIDKNGILRVMSVNDLPIGRSVDEMLRLIEAIQHVDTHGEVCPANWKKGLKTIKPDPRGAKEYFKNVHANAGVDPKGSGSGPTSAGSGPTSTGSGPGTTGSGPGTTGSGPGGSVPPGSGPGSGTPPASGGIGGGFGGIGSGPGGLGSGTVGGGTPGSTPPGHKK